MLKGIDISQHQAETPSLDGLSFIVLRATINLTPDTKYAQHYKAARDAGLIVMAYHFNGSSDIDAQADLFLGTAREADFLWLDQEDTASSKGFTDAQAQAFIDRVRQDRPCGLYHSASGFGGVNADARWVADWRAKSVAAGYPRQADGDPFPRWDLWQHSGGPLDLDYANPARPLANLLRLGFVANQQYVVVTSELQAAQKTITEQAATVDALSADIEALSADVERLTTELAGAPTKERDRIALAEAERIRNV